MIRDHERARPSERNLSRTNSPDELERSATSVALAHARAYVRTRSYASK